LTRSRFLSHLLTRTRTHVQVWSACLVSIPGVQQSHFKQFDCLVHLCFTFVGATGCFAGGLTGIGVTQGVCSSLVAIILFSRCGVLCWGGARLCAVVSPECRS